MPWPALREKQGRADQVRLRVAIPTALPRFAPDTAIPRPTRDEPPHTRDRWSPIAETPRPPRGPFPSLGTLPPNCRRPKNLLHQVQAFASVSVSPDRSPRFERTRVPAGTPPAHSQG